MLLWPFGAVADVRIATFAAPLSRDGPGLLLRDLGRDDDQITATIAIIEHIDPDVLLLTDIDFDLTLAALNAFNARLAHPFAYLFSAQPNSGLATGLDMDGNGRTGEPRDSQGYGAFFGDGGMAVLSRHPIGQIRDFTDLLWTDLPSARLPMLDGAVFPSEDAIAVQRLSSTNHWIVPIDTPIGLIDLLAFSATPPVFDGPEDRNGLRNADEIRLWELVLSGQFGAPPDTPVIIGNANLDPNGGDGLRPTIQSLLTNDQLTDPLPDIPTAEWASVGALRVSYILPSVRLDAGDADVFAPTGGEWDTAITAAGPHYIVWTDIKAPPKP